MHARQFFNKILILVVFFDQKYDSHKKRKDSLETRAVLLIFSFEIEISRVAVQRIHQNSEK